MRNQIIKKFGLAATFLFVLTGTLFGQALTDDNSVPAATEITVPAEASNDDSVNAAPKSLSVDDLERLEISSSEALRRTFSHPNLLGNAMSHGFSWFIIIAFSTALFWIACWTRKQIKAEKEYMFPEKNADSELSEEEMRELTLGESKMIDSEKDFFKDCNSGKPYEYLSNPTDIYSVHNRLQELSKKSRQGKEEQILNLEIRAFNQTLCRQDAAVLPSKLLRFFWGVFWCVLFFVGAIELWEGISGLKMQRIVVGVGVIVATIAFMIARHNCYKILTPDFIQHYHGDWIVKIYEGFWKFIGLATAAGVSAGAEEAKRTDVTIWYDRYSGCEVGRETNHHVFEGFMIMGLSIAAGFIAGFFMFTLVQPVLIFYLFWRYFYSRLPKSDNSTFPIKRDPKVFYVPVILGAAAFSCVTFFTNISLQKNAIWNEIASGRPQTEEAIAAEPIFEACRDEFVSAGRMEQIIKGGADVNVNIKGMTPLTIAIIHQNPVAVKALLDAGANPDFVMLNNEKICDHVKYRGNDEIKKLFQENISGTKE